MVEVEVVVGVVVGVVPVHGGRVVVVQQRGLDLSAGGVMSFTTVLVTALPTPSGLA